MNGTPNRMHLDARAGAATTAAAASASALGGSGGAEEKSIDRASPIAALQDRAGNAQAGAARAYDPALDTDRKHALPSQPLMAVGSGGAAAPMNAAGLGGPIGAPMNAAPAQAAAPGLDRDAPDRARHQAALARLPAADAYSRRPQVGMLNQIASRVLLPFPCLIAGGAGGLVGWLLGTEATPKGMELAMPNLYFAQIEVKAFSAMGADVGGVVLDGVTLNVGGSLSAFAAAAADREAMGRAIVRASFAKMTIPSLRVVKDGNAITLRVNATGVRAMGSMDLLKVFLHQIADLARWGDYQWDPTRHRTLMEKLAQTEGAFAVSSLVVDVESKPADDKVGAEPAAPADVKAAAPAGPTKDPYAASAKLELSDIALSRVGHDGQKNSPDNSSARAAVRRIRGRATVAAGGALADNAAAGSYAHVPDLGVDGVEAFQRNGYIDGSIGGMHANNIHGMHQGAAPDEKAAPRPLGRDEKEPAAPVRAGAEVQVGHVGVGHTRFGMPRKGPGPAHVAVGQIEATNIDAGHRGADGEVSRGHLDEIGIAASGVESRPAPGGMDLRARLGTTHVAGLSARGAGGGLDVEDATLGTSSASVRTGPLLTGDAEARLGVLDASNVRGAVPSGGAQASRVRVGGVHADAHFGHQEDHGAVAVGGVDVGGVFAQTPTARGQVGSVNIAGAAASGSQRGNALDLKGHVGQIDVNDAQGASPAVAGHATHVGLGGVDAAATRAADGRGELHGRLGTLAAQGAGARTDEHDVAVDSARVAPTRVDATLGNDGRLSGRAHAAGAAVEGVDAKVGHDAVKAQSARLVGAGATLDNTGKLAGETDGIRAHGVDARLDACGPKLDTDGPTAARRHVELDQVDVGDARVVRTANRHEASLASVGARGANVTLGEGASPSTVATTADFKVASAQLGGVSGAVGGLDRGAPKVGAAKLKKLEAKGLTGPVDVADLDMTLDETGTGKVKVDVQHSNVAVAATLDVERGVANIAKPSLLVAPTADAGGFKRLLAYGANAAWGSITKAMVGKYIKSKAAKADLHASPAALAADPVLEGPADAPTGVDLEAFLRHQIGQRLAGKVHGEREQHIESHTHLGAQSVTLGRTTAAAQVGGARMPRGPLGGVDGLVRPKLDHANVREAHATGLTLDQDIRRVDEKQRLAPIPSRLGGHAATATATTATTAATGSAGSAGSGGAGGGPKAQAEDKGVPLAGMSWPAFARHRTQPLFPPGASVEASRIAEPTALDPIAGPRNTRAPQPTPHVQALVPPLLPAPLAAGQPPRAPSGAGLLPPAAASASSGGDSKERPAAAPSAGSPVAAHSAGRAMADAMALMQPSGAVDPTLATRLDAQRHGESDAATMLHLRRAAGRERDMKEVAASLVVVDDLKRLEQILTKAAAASYDARALALRMLGADFQATWDFVRGTSTRLGVVLEQAAHRYQAAPGAPEWIGVRLDRAGAKIAPTTMASAGSGADHKQAFDALVTAFERLVAHAADGDAKAHPAGD